MALPAVYDEDADLPIQPTSSSRISQEARSIAFFLKFGREFAQCASTGSTAELSEARRLLR